MPQLRSYVTLRTPLWAQRNYPRSVYDPTWPSEPSHLPLARAFRNPALTLSTIRLRSSSATAPRTVKTSFPAGVEVSTCSDSETNSMPRAPECLQGPQQVRHRARERRSAKPLQQSEFRTVAGGNVSYVYRIRKAITLPTGMDLRRDAPRFGQT